MMARKTVVTGVLFLALIFSSLSSAFASGASTNVNPSATDANIFIDPSIQGQSRDVILNVMRTLDPVDRENVIYIDANGNFYANKPELLKGIQKLRYVGDNLYETSDGLERFAAPSEFDSKVIGASRGQFTLDEGGIAAQNDANAADVSCSTNSELHGVLGPLATQPPCTGGTGPYRRVTSTANYSWAAAYVHLPGGSEISDHNNVGAKDYNGDTGYVYMGGLGETGGHVDAGLMHSTLYDNWGPFFNITGVGMVTFGERFKGNQDVYLKFNVPSTGNIQLSVSGVLSGGSSTSTYTYVRAVSGFVYNGSNILKRVTSIGQSSENLNSGSWIRNVHWYSSQIGVSSTNYHSWLAADTYGYCSYTSAVVTVNYVNAGEETDNINL